MENEGRKIMHHPTFHASVTCVRVPVYRAHSVAVTAEFEKPVTVEAALEALKKAPGLDVVDAPDSTLVKSSDLRTAGQSTDRLISICRALEADTYLSGFGGQSCQIHNPLMQPGSNLRCMIFKPSHISTALGRFSKRIYRFLTFYSTVARKVGKSSIPSEFVQIEDRYNRWSASAVHLKLSGEQSLAGNRLHGMFNTHRSAL